MDEKKIIKKLSGVGIFGNVFLAAFKLFAGIYGRSGAMVSDAVHSLSDVFATFIAYIGVRLSQQKEDAEHPYGHERLECVASLTLGLILAGTGVGIGISGIKNLYYNRKRKIIYVQSRMLCVKCQMNRELSSGRRKQAGFRGFWVASRCYIKRLILCPPMWLKEKTAEEEKLCITKKTKID